MCKNALKRYINKHRPQFAKSYKFTSQKKPSSYDIWCCKRGGVLKMQLRCEHILPDHIVEAIQYWSLDREGGWVDFILFVYAIQEYQTFEFLT